MLSQSPKLSKQERKKMYEEYIKVRSKKSMFESKYNDQSVSSWDFVYYMMKYKSNE